MLACGVKGSQPPCTQPVATEPPICRLVSVSTSCRVVLQDPRLLSWWARWGWCLAVGVATSSAISIKWTGLATPGASSEEKGARCALDTGPNSYHRHIDASDRQCRDCAPVTPCAAPLQA
jgi:hypothetical protein